MHEGCEHHTPARYDTAFAVGACLNLAFVIAEVAVGAASRSLALLADAGHNAGDVVGLLMGWLAVVLARKAPTARRTYGWRRSSILVALANSALLLVAIGAVAWEAIQRFSEPVPVPGTIVMAVAGVGILINGGTALMFSRGRKSDINVEGAYLHMMTDALVAAGVVVAGYIMRLTGYAWVDPLTSLLLVALIGVGSWRYLRKSLNLALDAVPEGVDPAEVRSFLEGLPGVSAVTDLHIWAVSTTENALTAHLVAPNGLAEGCLQEASHEMHHRFGIGHSTMQVERQESAGCSLEAV